MASTIQVIGLGAGDLNQLPLGIYRKLTSEKQVIHVRTIDHPVISSLKEEGVSFISYDDVYENHDQFDFVYEEIVKRLVETVKKEQHIIYAVPGHPMLAEKTVQLLLEQTEVKIDIIGGQSYLDALFTAIRIDPIDGFQFIDATAFNRNQLDYRNHLIFCQVYDSFIASEVKLALLEDLPPEHPITVVDAVGSNKEKITNIPLVELDQTVSLSNLTSVYISPIAADQLNHQFFRLRDVIATLRGPNGCPWDKKQTHESLRKYLIEEAYEFIEAVNNQDDDAMVEELGDVLLQVMLHSQIGEDEGYFTIDDVIAGLTQKMIRRHPHVFGNQKVDSTEEVLNNWNQIKILEKGEEQKSIVDNIPAELPELVKAESIQKKAAKVGFDWNEVGPIWDKIEEELAEVKQAIADLNKEEQEAELGDLLFAIVNLARFYKINPELALGRTNQKFKARFQYIETSVKEKGLIIDEVSLEDLDKYWEEAKRKGL